MHSDAHRSTGAAVSTVYARLGNERLKILNSSPDAIAQRIPQRRQAFGGLGVIRNLLFNPSHTIKRLFYQFAHVNPIALRPRFFSRLRIPFFIMRPI